MKKEHFDVLNCINYNAINNSFAYQIEEREIVNWIYQNYKEMSLMYFHSLNTLRHGLTKFQVHLQC